MSTFVLVHGAWHTGELFEPVAKPIREAGHTVHCPTVTGNNPGDLRTTGLDVAITSITDYIESNDLKDVILLGHSYGGMVITGVADRIPGRLKRLIYWNAFVPNNGECLNDMVPPHYVGMFDAVSAESSDNSVMLPFPIWREAFINDGSSELAQSSLGVTITEMAPGEREKMGELSKDVWAKTLTPEQLKAWTDARAAVSK